MDMSALDAEHLAYWYFRLNGFMTTVNFVVHPEEGPGQRTDVDVLGVRFPYRAELLSQSMVDDTPFITETKRPYVVLAEVKTKRCDLNGPWTKPPDRNIQRVLTAVGAIQTQELDTAADSLYRTGVFQGGAVFVSLCCLGDRENPERKRRYPDVPQIVWSRVASFIYDRFDKYRSQKISHPQWDETGQALWKLSVDCQSLDSFINAVCKAISQR